MKSERSEGLVIWERSGQMERSKGASRFENSEYVYG